MATAALPASRRPAVPGPATLRRGALWIGLIVFLVSYPFISPIASSFWVNTCGFILIFAIGALGLNVLTGYCGQVSLGHAFFVAVGAYTGGVLGYDHGVTAALWIPAAGVIAALCGLLIGPTALRLRGLYLGIVTIGLVFIGQHIWLNSTSISGGPGGRRFPAVAFGSFDLSQQQTVLGQVLDSNALYYYLDLLLLAVSMLFVWNLSRTRLGRAMQAVREREIAAAIMGVDVARTKIAAFTISSFFAGIAGALYGASIHFTAPSPTTWDLVLSIQFVAIIIVGGIGTVWGAVLGSIFAGALPQVLNQYAGSIPGGYIENGTGSGVLSAGDAAAILYGVLIIAFLVAEPRGVVGIGARIRRLGVSLLARRRLTNATNPMTTPANPEEDTAS